jgi:hypothetical protein
MTGVHSRLCRKPNNGSMHFVLIVLINRIDPTYATTGGLFAAVRARQLADRGTLHAERIWKFKFGDPPEVVWRKKG